MRRACPLTRLRMCVAALALATASLTASSPAQAWTDARVISADAHVDVWPDGSALVRLALQLEVRAGYLSSFELSGLDPGLALDPDKPPSLLAADGRKARPHAELRPEGTLLLSFDRAQAPRRGHHVLELLYVTRLARSQAADGQAGTTLVLPAFRTDLEDVDLWIDAPPGTTVAPQRAGAPDFALTRVPLPRGSRSVLHLHRAHLPRTLALTAELRWPAPPSTAKVAANAPAPLAERSALLLAACVLALAALKVLALRAGARLLVPLPAVFRATLMLAFGAAGAHAYARAPELGLALLVPVVALALARRTPALSAAEAPRGLNRLLALFSAAGWLDATTPPGLSLLASAYLLAWGASTLSNTALPAFELLLLVTPLFLTGTRPRVRRMADSAEMQGSAPGPASPAPPTSDPTVAGQLSPIAAAVHPARDRAA